MNEKEALKLALAKLAETISENDAAYIMRQARWRSNDEAKKLKELLDDACVQQVMTTRY